MKTLLCISQTSDLSVSFKVPIKTNFHFLCFAVFCFPLLTQFKKNILLTDVACLHYRKISIKHKFHTFYPKKAYLKQYKPELSGIKSTMNTYFV